MTTPTAKSRPQPCLADRVFSLRRSTPISFRGSFCTPPRLTAPSLTVSAALEAPHTLSLSSIVTIEVDGSYILIEVAEYFDTVLKPRVLKAVVLAGLASRKTRLAPRHRPCIKVIRLESYEDALNNLETRRTAAQQLLLDDRRGSGRGWA